MFEYPRCRILVAVCRTLEPTVTDPGTGNLILESRKFEYSDLKSNGFRSFVSSSTIPSPTAMKGKTDVHTGRHRISLRKTHLA